MLGKKKTKTELRKHRDELTKKLYMKEFSTDGWKYRFTPTYFYDLWEKYIANGDSIQYPWDKCKYPQKRESDMIMCEILYGMYRRACGLNFVQLEIPFEKYEGVCQ